MRNPIPEFLPDDGTEDSGIFVVIIAHVIRDLGVPIDVEAPNEVEPLGQRRCFEIGQCPEMVDLEGVVSVKHVDGLGVSV